MTAIDRPLEDIRVVELGHIVAGPFCSMLLADFGAEIVKVERPDGGDAIRESSPIGASTFNYVNRNKQSITLDLKTETGREVFFELIEESDVVVENFAPGTANQLGIGSEALRARNPDLVYCSIKGFNSGPYEYYPALDPIAEAMAGLMSTTGSPDQPPARAGTSFSDMAASLYGALAVVSAIRQRDHTGEGQFLEVPLFESTVSLMGYWLAYAEAYDRVPEPLGAGHPNWSPYDVFQAADDRWVFIGPSSQRQWVDLCEALGCTLHEKDRFETVADRRRNEDELTNELQFRIATLESDVLIEELREAGVPVALVRNVKEVAADPHLAETNALGTVQTAEGRGATVPVPRLPVRSSAFDRIESSDPPQLGEHTEIVLNSLGYDAEAIDRLQDDDVV